MRASNIRAFAASALMTAPVLATPCLAGSPYYDAPDMASPARMDARPIPTRRIGHFSCSFNERRTRLERKNCGGTRY